MGSLQDEISAGLSGRYEIERELGRGGMAVVFLATDLRHGRQVAIKVMDVGVATGVGAARFQREIRSVARLSHPHVLPVLDSGELPGPQPRAWYAMPYVAGGTLRDRLRREGALPVADAVRIVAEAAEALDYAHRQGLIHRDVKPENVLLQDGQAVVADFGIAGAATGSDPEHRLTETGMVMGTALYMSPEQATGSASVDSRSDVYSLGCVLYEALTGHAPFADADSTARILARVVTEDPPPVSRERPSAAGLDPLVARALARLAADRFDTAGELARALRSSTPAQGLAQLATPASGISDTGASASASRRWLRVAAVGAVAVAAAFALVYMANRNRTPAAATGAGAASSRPSVAVLSFDNLSPDSNDAYFAAGIHEEIRTQLARVKGIRLIAGPSVIRDQDRQKRPSEIAQELGVSTILRGSVRRAGEEVRIAVELYDAAANEQIWGQSYERQLSDIFEIQSDVASRVVEEVRGVLSPEERAELAGPSTTNPEAYSEYLRGQASFRTLFVAEDARAAAAAYGRAVELDPQFTAAWSRLVQARLWLAWLWGEPEQRGAARAALDRLEELAPGSAELRLARGLWLYYGVQHYEEALAEMEALVDLWPGETYAVLYVGALQRRLGRWDQSVRTWERALELEPLNAGTASNIAQTLTTMRRFGDAERYIRQSLSLNQDVPVDWWHLVWIRLQKGDTASARTIVDSASLQVGRQRMESGGWWALWQVYSGNLPQALDLYREVYDGDPLSLDGTWGRSWDLGLAAAAAAGQTETVRAFASSLRDGEEGALASVPEDDPETRSDVMSKLALAEAYLGNGERAIRLAEEAVEMYPVSRDASWGPSRVEVLAQVYAMLGRRDEAVDQLRYLLSIPSEVSVGRLRISPRWSMLRDHPGYQALLAQES